MFYAVFLPDWLGAGTPRGLPRGLFSPVLSVLLPPPSDCVSAHLGQTLRRWVLEGRLLCPEPSLCSSLLFSPHPWEPQPSCLRGLPAPFLTYGKRPGLPACPSLHCGLEAHSGSKLGAVRVPLVFSCFLMFSVMKIVTLHTVSIFLKGESKCNLCDRNEHWNSRI